MNELQAHKPLTKLPFRNLPSSYQYDIKLFNAFLKEHALEVTLASIQAFFHAKNNLSSSTKRRYIASIKKSLLQTLGSKLTFAQRAEIDIFFKDLKKGFTKKDIAIAETEYLTEEELRDIIQLAGRKTSLIIQALYQTACRVSELLSITLSNCTIRGDIVHIHIIGKGKFERDVAISLQLFQDIKQEYPGKTFLFETTRNTSLDRTTVYRLIRQAGKQINRPDCTPHKIRHSWASHHIHSLGLVKVSKYLGHKQIQTSASFYLHGKASMEEIFRANKEILK